MSCGGVTRSLVLNGSICRLRVMTLGDYVELGEQACASRGIDKLPAIGTQAFSEWCQRVAAYVHSAAGREWWLRRCSKVVTGRWGRRRSLQRLRRAAREQAGGWSMILHATDGLVSRGSADTSAVQDTSVQMDWGAIYRLACESRGWDPRLVRRLTLEELMALFGGRHAERIVVADSWSGARRMAADIRVRRAQQTSATCETNEARWCARLEITLGRLLTADLPGMKTPHVTLDMSHWELPSPREPVRCPYCARQHGEQRLLDEAGARERHWARWVARQVVEQLADELSTNRQVAKRWR